ncbi:MAG: tryptophan synthase subunit alpha [Solirubrobacteraceae bacterium]
MTRPVAGSSAEAPASGLERIAEAFARARAEGRRAALMPYLMAGFPDLETSLRIGMAYVEGGADLVELGIPFSDPLADGPVIHQAATAALRAGVTVQHALDVGQQLAAHVPVVAMGYSNPIFARGPDRFLEALSVASISGLIVPDLPLEEAGELRALCDARGIALVPLAAPTTPDDRLARIGADARGFLYAVSVTGTTGERSRLDTMSQVVSRAAAHTHVPVAVGFGIATPEAAREALAAGADGVIVGTRLVRAAGLEDDPVGAVRELMSSFAQALS